MSFKKLLQLMLIITCLPFLIFGIVTYNKSVNEVTKEHEHSLTQLASSTATGIDAMAESLSNDVKTLSQRDSIRSILSSDNSNTSVVSNDRFLKALQVVDQFLNSHSAFHSISLYNKEGQLILQSMEDTNIDKATQSTLAYLQNSNQIAFGVSGPMEINDDMGTTYGTQIGYPVIDTDTNTPQAYIILTFSMDYFHSFLNINNSNNFTNAMLIDLTGNLLYSNNISDDNYTLSNNLLNAIYNQVDLSNLSLKQQSGYFNYNEGDTSSRYFYTTMPNLSWCLVLEEDLNFFYFQPFYYKLFFTTLLSTILLIILISHKLDNSYTKPIIKLRDTIQQAADGDLGVRSELSNNSEVNELSNSFNKMIHIIKTNYDELTSMHKTLIEKEVELRNNYAQIEYLAYHDLLTDLPNKLTFNAKMNEVLISSAGRNLMHAVYFVDLDNFKTINDTLGHDFGDQLLSKTSAKLSSLLTAHDMLARAGGDEFLIFRENIDSELNATTFAANIIKAFKTPFNIDGELVYISMSIGISMYPENGVTYNNLIKNADIAMYKSKDTGKNKFTLFNKKMHEELSRNAEILEVLRNAIENKDVYLLYQPQVSIDTKEVIGYEALMRIRNEKLGIISPSEFIPIAEDSGLIIELGAWALYEACRFTKELIDERGVPLTVSVNISSIQLNRVGFFTTLADVLDQTELPPECLELEITESMVLSSLVDTNTLLKNFQTLGVKIALDDFGTGYSSLNYLTNIPINTLKIDKSFIDNIGINQKDTYVAETIIQLAHNLNIHVIAEGVEDTKQLNLLEEYNCDLIQGYVFSKPLDSQNIKEYVNAIG